MGRLRPYQTTRREHRVTRSGRALVVFDEVEGIRGAGSWTGAIGRVPNEFLNGVD